MARAKVIDDSVIRQLMKTSLAVQAFPFLQTPPKLPPIAGCCGKRPQPRIDFNSIKAALANLSGSDQALLLKILQWPDARVIYAAGKATVEKTLPS